MLGGKIFINYQGEKLEALSMERFEDGPPLGITK
jgi:hypothetical protein